MRGVSVVQTLEVFVVERHDTAATLGCPDENFGIRASVEREVATEQHFVTVLICQQTPDSLVKVEIEEELHRRCGGERRRNSQTD